MSTAEELPFERIITRGLAEASPEDLQAVREAMAHEQNWLADEPRYDTNEDVVDAYERGELVLIEHSESYRPVKTLLEPQNFDTYQPYLTPGAAEALYYIGELGQIRIREYGIEGEIRFPVTSMVRSMERQAQIAAEPGKLALPPEESGHPTGWDVDIDSSSYYLWEDGEWKSVSRRNPNKQKQISHARERVIGKIAAPTNFIGSERYDPKVRLALHRAIADLYADDILFPVMEYPHTVNELIHIGVNPRYFQSG